MLADSIEKQKSFLRGSVPSSALQAAAAISERLYDHQNDDADHKKRGDLIHDSPVTRRLIIARPG